jgi:6,7-dimethyl-8-ribityllumazine synthase
MAKSIVDLSGLPEIENPGRVAILKGKWYPDIVDSLSETCEAVLAERGFDRVEVHTVPGSLELPLAAADLLAEDSAGEIEAVICFSVIVKGETLHFETVSNECMRGLMDVGLTYRRPVIVEVLPVFDIEDARARARDDEFNKGYEAAAAAIEMIAWRRSVVG